MARVSTGVLTGGSPYLAVGEGPPLVVVQELTATHEVPSGIERRLTLSHVAPLSSAFRVFVVNRKHGLTPGESMADIAGHLATGIEAEFGGPVLLTGASTGGSVALQLAVDRPDLVQALVMVASAYRLGPLGQQVTRDLVRLTRQGDFAAGWAKIGLEDSLPAPLRGLALPLFRLLARPMTPDNPTDMQVTLQAEEAFNVGHRLDRVRAPTLVIGGAKDPFYPRELLEQTAARSRTAGRTSTPAGDMSAPPGPPQPRTSHSASCSQPCTPELTEHRAHAMPSRRPGPRQRPTMAPLEGRSSALERRR